MCTTRFRELGLGPYIQVAEFWVQNNEEDSFATDLRGPEFLFCPTPGCLNPDLSNKKRMLYC